MGYILSVDGGGSKTLYCLYEIENGCKEYIKGNSTNYKNIGIDVVKSNLEKNINEIMNKKNISFQDIKYFVFGFSSCDTAEDYKLFKKILEDIGIKENFVIMNDAELAFRVICPFEDGGVIVSGTGSIAFAFDDKKVVRVGGWGKELSDLGSGYWIGRKFLEKYILYLEGMEEKDKSFDKVEIFADNRRKQLEKIVEKYDTTEKIASIAKFVIKEKDTLLCEKILDEAVAELMKMVKQISKNIKKDKYTLVLSGGVAVNEIVTVKIKEKIVQCGLENKIKLVANKYEPVDGGINIGLNYLNKNI